MRKQDVNNNKIGDTVISDGDTNVTGKKSKTLEMTCITLIEEHNFKKMNASQMRSYVQKLITDEAIKHPASSEMSDSAE